jgi:hypothetical protein
MSRQLLLFSIFLCSEYFAAAQTHTVSVGVFTGLTSTYTWDQGVNLDSRYKNRYDVKLAPIGINYGVDYDGYGFIISPGLINIGQNYDVINTSGGHEGVRKINLQYINLPAAFKLHVIDMSFFKVSLVSGASFAYLLKGKEFVSHNATKLKFPSEVLPIDIPGYDEVYDGVYVPGVHKYPMLNSTDFNSFQIFAHLGFRSDWDVSDDWRISFDFRVNYGILEPRTDDYMRRLKAHETLYDLPGKRRDLFAQFGIAFSRYKELEKKEKVRKKQGKGTTKKYAPKKYPWPGPRKSHPKG